MKGEKKMPKDPVMLLSYVNTQLRDHYKNLQEFCRSEDVTEEELCSILRAIDYEYHADCNQFR